LVDAKLIRALFKLHVFNRSAVTSETFFKDPRLIQLLGFARAFPWGETSNNASSFNQMNYETKK
jgi:hypothetical protein